MLPGEVKQNSCWAPVSGVNFASDTDIPLQRLDFSLLLLQFGKLSPELKDSEHDIRITYSGVKLTSELGEFKN